MIKEDDRQTFQLSQLMRELRPLLDCDELDYDWTFYLKNDTKDKDRPKFFEYTRMTLIGFKDDHLYFKFDDGKSRPLSYDELKRTYWIHIKKRTI